MVVIKNLYLNKNVVLNAGYPYEGAQEEVLMVKDDILIIEFDNGTYSKFYLDNNEIEYSLEIKASKVDECSKLLKLKGAKYNNFIGQRILNIKHLYLANGVECVVDQNSISEEPYSNRVGVRYLFENGNELYVYSAEPEEISAGTYKIFRPNSVICLIFFDYKNGRIRPVEKTEFCELYLETAVTKSSE